MKRNEKFFENSSTEKTISQSLASARKNGALKVVNKGLVSWPSQLDGLYDQSQLAKDEKWWENVPLKSINLSQNAITEIGEKIVLHEEVEVVDLSNNKIAQTIPQLFQMPMLKSCDLSHNELAGELPSSVQEAKSLADLNLQHNKLSSIGSVNLQQLDRLLVLRLDHNSLKLLPEGLPMNLTTLTVSHNRLQSIPQAVAKMRKLTTLECGYNELKMLPDLSQLAELQVLNVDNNKLTSMPPLPEGKSLVEVQAASNNLLNVNGVEKCRGLKTLVLHSNNLSELQPSLASLPLEILDVSNNNLNDVPSELGKTQTLVKLVLHGNFLRKLKRNVTELGINDLKKYLRSRLTSDDEKQTSKLDLNLMIRDAKASKVLHLRYNDMEDGSIPGEAMNIEALRELDVSGNKFTTIDRGLLQVRESLRCLVYDENQLKDLSVVPQLVFLEALHLRKNCIVSVPPLKNLHQLHTLDLRNNQLSAIEQTVTELASLKRLFLGFNAIREVSPKIVNLAGTLEELDLSSNKIEALPDGFHKMSVLLVLNLENNSLSNQPFELGFMDNLKTLMMSGNPLKTVPYDILRKGNEQLKSFLKKRSPVQYGADEKDNTASLEDESLTLALLREKIAKLTEELEDLSLTNAKKYALKKELAKHKAELIREERKRNN